MKPYDRGGSQRLNRVSLWGAQYNEGARYPEADLSPKFHAS